MAQQLMPFRFETLGDESVLLTNELGRFTYLPNNLALRQLIQESTVEPEYKASLIENGIITTNEDERQAHIATMQSALAYRYQASLTPPYLFMIVPTLRCDHDCFYCQVSRVHESEKGYDLDTKLIPDIIHQIQRYGASPYKIEFQGGEPLIAFDFIQQFVEAFNKVIGEEDVEYVIATSLSKLNDSVLVWAQSNNIKFSISLDGTALVHDANRRHVLFSSHERVISGVHKIVQFLGTGRIGTVTTVTRKTLDNPHDIIQAHRELGLREMFVRPLSPFGFSAKKFDQYYSVDEYFDFYETLIRQLIEDYDNALLVEENLSLHLRRIYQSGFNSYVDLKSPAGYVLGSIIFDYNGYVFGSDEARMLYKTYGLSNLSLGHVSDQLMLDKNTDLINTLSNSFITEMPGCDECAYSPYCGVDVMHHLSTQGDPIGNKSISRFCQYQKRTFDLIFRLLKDKQSRTVLEEWVYD